MQDIIEFLQFRLDLAQRIAAQRKEEDAEFMRGTQKMITETFGKKYVLVPSETDTVPVGVMYPEPVDNDITWVVRLYEFDKAKNKLNVVKAVRDFCDFPGLKEAKDACDKAAEEVVTILTTKDRQKVNEFCKLLEEYGAKFSLTTQEFLDHEQEK
jgi:ribosomal protein L7/L12